MRGTSARSVLRSDTRASTGVCCVLRGMGYAKHRCSEVQEIRHAVRHSGARRPENMMHTTQGVGTGVRGMRHAVGCVRERRERAERGVRLPSVTKHAEH